MKYHPVLIIICFLISMFSCHNRISQASTWEAAQIEFTNLVAENLSEGITGNDEIAVHTFFVEPPKVNQPATIYHYLFDEINVAQELDLKFNLNGRKDAYFVIVLIEKDAEKDKSVSNHLIITKELAKLKFIDNPFESARIAKLIGDDDLLDIKYFKVKEIKTKQTFKVLFEGSHLFDRYKYILTCKTN